MKNSHKAAKYEKIFIDHLWYAKYKIRLVWSSTKLSPHSNSNQKAKKKQSQIRLYPIDFMSCEYRVVIKRLNFVYLRLKMITLKILSTIYTTCNLLIP